MSLTLLQQKHILLTIIDEGIHLANKFGFEKGATGLIRLKDQVEKLPNDESTLKKLIEVKKALFFAKLQEIFGISDAEKNLSKLFDSSDKEIKKIIKSDATDIQKELTEYVKSAVKRFIKDRFKVSHKYISEAQNILTKNMKFFVVNLAEIAEQLATNNAHPNFNFYGVQINSLYKLIKILNGINDKQLAKQFVPYFEKEKFNHSIIKAFFDAEKTEGYFRHPTLLVLIFTQLIKKHPAYATIISNFTESLSITPPEKSSEELLVKNDSLTKKGFLTLIDDILKLTGHFEPCLQIAAESLANREKAIRSLHTTPDIFLKTGFYFGCVSPFLKGIEKKLPESWPEQTSKMLRLELSIAFDLVLGLQSARGLEKIKNSGVICPALLELCTSTELQDTVHQSFKSVVQSTQTTANVESSSSEQDIPEQTNEKEKVLIKEQQPAIKDINFRKKTVTFYTDADGEELTQKITSPLKQRRHVRFLFDQEEAASNSASNPPEESVSLTH